MVNNGRYLYILKSKLTKVNLSDMFNTTFRNKLLITAKFDCMPGGDWVPAYGLMIVAGSRSKKAWFPNA